MDALTAVLQGLPMTILLTISAFLIGAVGAVPLALGLTSRPIIIRLFCRLLVDFIRGVPIIVWLFVLKFGIHVGAFRFEPVMAAIVGLGIVSMAYLAEIYRGGIQAVPAGQIEASQAMGLNGSTTFFRVVLPQAFRIVSPSIATYFTGLLKDSSIAATVIVTEMVFQAQSFARQHPTAVGILPYLIAGALYILLSLPVAVFSRRMDRKMREAAHA